MIYNLIQDNAERELGAHSFLTPEANSATHGFNDLLRNHKADTDPFCSILVDLV